MRIRWERPEDRPWWQDELIAIAIALLAGFPLLVGRTYFINDAAGLALPLFAAVGRAIQEGQALVWNPDLFGGYPGLAAGQTGSYYPLNWLLLSLFPTVTAFRFSYLFHFWLLARGLVGFSRSVRTRTAGVVATAAVGVLGGAVSGHHLHHNVVIGMAWTGPILWFTVLTLRASRPLLPVLLLGACFGLSLLQSHPQYVWMSFLAMICVAPWLRDRGRSGWRAAGRLSAALGLGALLATPQLLPTLEYVAQFGRTRPGGAFAFLTAGSFAPRDWLRLFQPDLWGSPLRGDWREPAFLYWETRGFCGLVFGAIAFARLISGRYDGPTRAGLTLVLVALFLMLGRYNPLYHLLIHLPPFSLFRGPGRAVWLLQLGVALLAGRGLKQLHRRAMPRRAMLVGAGLVAAGVLAGLLTAGVGGYLARLGPPAAGATLLGLILLLALVPLTRLQGQARRRVTRLAMIVGLVELVISYHSFAVTRPAAIFVQPPPLAEPILQDDHRRIFDLGIADPLTDPTAQIAGLASNVGLIWGLGYLRGGLEALPPQGHLKVLAEIEEAARESPARLQFYLDRYSVAWVVSGQRLTDPSLRRVRTDRGVTLFENVDSRPLVYALSPRHLGPIGVQTGPADLVDLRPVEWVERRRDEWVVRTEFSEPMAVVLAQSMYPGWMVFIDGRQAQLTGAERIFMSTLVQPGRHEVRFRFDNAFVWLGAALGKGAWALWLVTALAGLWRRRRERNARLPDERRRGS